MPDTDLSGHVWPEDTGTGVADGNEDWDSAGYIGGMAARDNASDYVEAGLSITPDYATPAFDLGAGLAFIKTTAAVPVQEPTDDADTYSGSWDQGVTFAVDVDAEAGVALTDGATNYIFLAVDPTANDSHYIHVDTDDTPPGDPSIKIAEVDTANDTSTEVNRAPDATFGTTTHESVLTGEVNRTFRVQPSDDVASVVSNLSTGDTVILDTEPGSRVHAVDSTLTFNAAVTIVFRGYVKPTGDFTAIQLNNAVGTYTIRPEGSYVVASDDDNVTTAGSHGLVAKNGYSMSNRGRVSGFGGHGVYMLQDADQNMNHTQPNWIIGNCGGNGFRSENTSANARNINTYQGLIHTFNCADDGVRIVDGSRHNLTVIGANGTDGSSALSEGANAGKNFYHLEEEGWGSNPTVNPSSRLWVVSSDNVSPGGWYRGNPRKAVSFQGSDGVLPVEQFYEFHCDSGTAHAFTLPEAPQGTEVICKDLDGNAGTNNLTFDASGSPGTIDNGTTEVISSDYGWRRFIQVSSGGGSGWLVVGSN